VSQVLLGFLLLFYLVLMVSSLIEGKNVMALYWAGAVILNTAVFMMK